LRRAGIKDFRVHDCRHTFATWHYAVHHDLIALQRLGGWRTLGMVSRYAHANVAAYHQGIEALPSLCGSESLTTKAVQPGIVKREAS
jgi:integrase